jgi:NADH dehydrogenase
MNVVTGSFGYIGRHITSCLLELGEEVRTITTHPNKPNPFGAAVAAFPLNFDKPEHMVEALQGASTLYNTYWIRFGYGGATFDQAVRNTEILFNCARQAGVQKIVHISVTKASMDSDLPYYRGKARQEQLLIESGLAYQIIRPTLVFGLQDILVNNIAWLLRRFPVFPVFGDGQYRLQPVYVADLAEIAVSCAASGSSQILDAAGPESYTFEELVASMASVIKPDIHFWHVPAWLGIALGRLIGVLVGDVILTLDEARGLMSSLLTSDLPPNGRTNFRRWLGSNHDQLGRSYASEIKRHFHWTPE